MAATLAGVCQVPLTSIILLFELTQDYRIFLPLMGAVGISSWIASVAQKSSRTQTQGSGPASSPARSNVAPSSSSSSSAKAAASPPSLAVLERGVFVLRSRLKEIVNWARAASGSTGPLGPERNGTPNSEEDLGTRAQAEEENEALCHLDSSLCLSEIDLTEDELMEEICVREAMRTQFLTVKSSTAVSEAVSRMIHDKEWCAVVVTEEGCLQGILTLADVQREAELVISTRARIYNKDLSTLPVATIATWPRETGRGRRVVTCSPDMNLRTAQRLMALRGLRQLPVVVSQAAPHEQDKVMRSTTPAAAAAADDDDDDDEASSVHANNGCLHVVGMLDRERLPLACRAELTRKVLALVPPALDATEPRRSERQRSWSRIGQQAMEFCFKCSDPVQGFPQVYMEMMEP
ncbi:hypothetical protein CBR_g12709 [Chara braunii]|uniref:CBS domain-containing protein n=1 Tax=Chara braunii TaxID=69332 RepID=A0A388KSE8_CHABU|nr:hypothetical protein CBR_g12709 [Chara braunii]|eukprot:GBG72990.1 hypothetical protein CBR_g12709 [Chara braunii]